MPLLHLLALEKKLDGLSQLATGWDGYAAEPPAAAAIGLAKSTLGHLQLLGILPERIVPSAEGGVGLVLTTSPYYAALECFNDGEMLASFSDGGSRHRAWETDLERLDGTLTELQALASG